MQRQLLNDGHESRRSKRFPIDAPLRFRMSCEEDWRKARTENISSTGVLFRCEQCAGQGAHVELNFLLLNSAGDQVGLEVACEGDVVRLDLPLADDELPALAVNITAYRLGPGRTGQWDLDKFASRSGGDE